MADVATPEFSGSARSAALDLSLVDGRFAPDLLATEVKRAVAAWAGAIATRDVSDRTAGLVMPTLGRRMTRRDASEAL